MECSDTAVMIRDIWQTNSQNLVLLIKILSWQETVVTAAYFLSHIKPPTMVWRIVNKKWEEIETEEKRAYNPMSYGNHIASHNIIQYSLPGYALTNDVTVELMYYHNI